MTSKGFYAVIAGVGPGTGRAIALRFAKTYPVVLLARKPESLQNLATEIQQSGGQALGVKTDVSDPKSVQAAFEKIQEQFAGSKLAAAVYHVGGGLALKPFLETNLGDLEASLSANPRGLYNVSKNAIPLLLDAVGEAPHPPSLIVTGATASLKGSARFATFATGKFAKRALTQSLAREFGPQGVHVAHVIIDGVIDTQKTRGYNPADGARDAKISPEAIADNYWWLHTQPRSAFTFESDLRPYVEKF